MFNGCSGRLGKRLTASHYDDPGTHADGLVCRTVILRARHGFYGDIDGRAHRSARNGCFDGGAVDADRKKLYLVPRSRSLYCVT